MGIDSIDNDLFFGGERFSQHELTHSHGSRWEGREVRKVSNDSLEIPSVLNSLQPSTDHLLTIESQSPPRTDAVVNRSNQEIQGDINRNRPREWQEAAINVQESRDAEERRLENNARETYRKYYSGEELEKVVQWAMNNFRRAQKEGRDPEPSNLDQEGPTLDAHHLSSEIKPIHLVQESRDAEERRLANNARETYRKYYSGEELEKVVQWAMNNFRRAQKEGRDPEPSNLDQVGPTLDAHHLSPVIKPIHPLSSVDFNKGFVKGLPKGVKDSGTGLLSMAKEVILHPVDTGEQMWDSLVLIKDLVRSGEWETLSEALVPEIHQLVTEWETIPSEERGRMAGYAFGKYGADILIPGALAKLASKGIKGVQGLNVVHKGLQSAERTLLRESVVGFENSAKVAEVVKDISAVEKAGIVNEELNALKNVSLVGGEAATGSLEGRIIAREGTEVSQGVLKEAGVTEARVGGTTQTSIIKNELTTTIAVEAESSAGVQVGSKEVTPLKEPQKATSPIRTEPRNLQEQLALQKTKAGAGTEIPPERLKIKDPNYPTDDWAKMEYLHEGLDGNTIEIHFWKNRHTGETHGFKFKDKNS